MKSNDQNQKRLQTTILNLILDSEKSPKRVENTVGKGETACNEQLLLFLKSFIKTCSADM